MKTLWLFVFIVSLLDCSIVLAVDLPGNKLLCLAIPSNSDPINTIRPVYQLYTAFNTLEPQILDARDENSILSSNFDSNEDTVFIIHGWRGDVRLPWYFIHSMKNEFLKKKNYNIIVVDNQKALNTINYFLAIANNKASADITTELITALRNLKSLKLKKLHLVGHSLGAQHCGYVGHQIPGIGRITGLDPAGWCFEDRPTDQRLDKGDAEFVDVIHTSGFSFFTGGVGYDGECGHVDFYPNGGQFMPGCVQISTSTGVSGNFDLLRAFETTFGCSHFRACGYFEESINSPCKFEGKTCKDTKFLLITIKKTCECGDKGCNIMGLDASPDKTLGRLELTTNADKPYCQK